MFNTLMCTFPTVCKCIVAVWAHRCLRHAFSDVSPDHHRQHGKIHRIKSFVILNVVQSHQVASLKKRRDSTSLPFYPHRLPGSFPVSCCCCRAPQGPQKYPEEDGPRPPSWRMDLHTGQGYSDRPSMSSKARLTIWSQQGLQYTWPHERRLRRVS